MIKVLHIADKLSIGDSTIHGVTRLFSWWVPRFDKNRYDVSICSLRKRDNAGEYLEKIGIKVFYLNKGKFDPFTLPSLIRIVRNERVDILHLHGYGAWTFGRMAGVLCNIPTVAHEHMVDRNIPVYQRLADRILAGATTYAIAASNMVKDFIVRYRGVPEDRVKVVINGIPMESFGSPNCRGRQAVGVADWRARLSIPPNHKVVGTVGRLSLIKGHRYLLEAAFEVLKKYPEVTFLIVGDGELRGLLEEMTKQLGIHDHVRFTGHCDDVIPLYAIMDIMVIASLSEGGPITLFEAMASRCAVVSTSTIGLRNTIEDSRTGFLVPPSNSKALAEKILLLLNDSDLCKAIAVRAKEASYHYDILNTVRQLELCYNKILRKR